MLTVNALNGGYVWFWVCCIEQVCLWYRGDCQLRWEGKWKVLLILGLDVMIPFCSIEGVSGSSLSRCWFSSPGFVVLVDAVKILEILLLIDWSGVLVKAALRWVLWEGKIQFNEDCWCPADQGSGRGQAWSSAFHMQVPAPRELRSAKDPEPRSTAKG